MLTIRRVPVYALVSYHVQSIIEVFSDRAAAEKFLEEVRQDEPELAEMLGVDAIELGEENPN